MNRLIPMSMIYQAMNGDEVAISAVISHYRGYIRFLSRRPCRDDLGFEHLYVDEDMQRRLESKLTYAVITKFKILKED
ncbi:MAG: helix-turn-helix domain-containing protein [Oscillospiraceae bacterium]|nr:helix-turn-helix domain-containing protein [Oscillospiraceae bacterium]